MAESHLIRSDVFGREVIRQHFLSFLPSLNMIGCPFCCKCSNVRPKQLGMRATDFSVSTWEENIRRWILANASFVRCFSIWWFRYRRHLRNRPAEWRLHRTTVLAVGKASGHRLQSGRDNAAREPVENVCKSNTKSVFLCLSRVHFRPCRTIANRSNRFSTIDSWRWNKSEKGLEERFEGGRRSDEQSKCWTHVNNHNNHVSLLFGVFSCQTLSNISLHLIECCFSLMQSHFSFSLPSNCLIEERNLLILTTILFHLPVSHFNHRSTRRRIWLWSRWKSSQRIKNSSEGQHDVGGGSWSLSQWLNDVSKTERTSGGWAQAQTLPDRLKQHAEKSRRFSKINKRGEWVSNRSRFTFHTFDKSKKSRRNV